jgi:hypothetical protein
MRFLVIDSSLSAIQKRFMHQEEISAGETKKATRISGGSYRRLVSDFHPRIELYAQSTVGLLPGCWIPELRNHS